MSAETDAVAVDQVPDALEQSSQCLRGIANLQSLLTQGRVEEARRFVQELEADWPESDLVRRFGHVLAPPAARVVAEERKGLSREQVRAESAWLRMHAKEYPGCWVILQGDRLISVHPRLRSAIDEADRLVSRDVGSIHYIPSDVIEE
ncbi:MAG: hypothetical protein ACR2PL_09040 [Dehalococcoidia bacterium]